MNRNYTICAVVACHQQNIFLLNSFPLKLILICFLILGNVKTSPMQLIITLSFGSSGVLSIH